MLTDAEREIFLSRNKNAWLKDLFNELIRYRAAYDEKYNLRDLLKWFDRFQGQVRIELNREEENAN